MAKNIVWQFFDSNNEAVESRRNLPHIDMPGAVTFVTFRLADSMPRKIVEQWHNEVDCWLKENGLAGQSVDKVLTSPIVDKKTKAKLRKFKNRCWHGHLDDCHRECVLRRDDLREEVAKAVLHFDRERYDIERFVIMPNHVHVLMQMRYDFLLRKELENFLRYSARTANRITGGNGPFWQTEPFDHVVRSEKQFAYLQDYIDQNPAKAILREGEYALYHS